MNRIRHLFKRWRRNDIANVITTRVTRTIPLAGLEVPEYLLEGSYTIVGAIGTGKTRLIREAVRPVLESIRPGSGRGRGILFDTKRDWLNELYTWDIGCPVHVLNPYDDRGIAWDLAKDIKSPQDIVNFATALVPMQERENPYFSETAKAITASTVERLIERRGEDWTFRDFLLLTESRKRLRRFLKGSSVITQHFENEKVVNDVLSTLATAAYRLRPVAAAWERAEKISLTDWAHGQESIIIVGGSPGDQESLAPINRCMFRHVSWQWLDGPDRPGEHCNFIVNDELSEGGKIPGLRESLGAGRSKGVVFFGGLQDTEGMTIVHGRDGSMEIPGKCHSVSILKVASVDTAKWAVSRIGEVDEIEFLASYDHEGKESIGQHRHRHDLVMAGELLDPRLTVVKTDRHLHIYGVHLVNGIGAFKSSPS